MRKFKPKWIFEAVSDTLEIYENVSNRRRLNQLNKAVWRERRRRIDAILKPGLFRTQGLSIPQLTVNIIPYEPSKDKIKAYRQ